MSMLEQMTVTNPAAAAAFSSIRSRSIMFALMRSEQSLQELREASGMSLSLLHYHVQRLMRLGLVRQVCLRARAGRPIAVYRAVAASFSVSGSIAETEPGIGLRAKLQAALDQAKLASDIGTTIYFLDEHQRPKMRRVPIEALAPGAGELWWRLSLSNREAQELSDSVRKLISSYEGRLSRSEKSVLCYFALAQDLGGATMSTGSTR